MILIDACQMRYIKEVTINDFSFIRKTTTSDEIKRNVGLLLFVQNQTQLFKQTYRLSYDIFILSHDQSFYPLSF